MARDRSHRQEPHGSLEGYYASKQVDCSQKHWWAHWDGGGAPWLAPLVSPAWCYEHVMLIIP